MPPILLLLRLILNCVYYTEFLNQFQIKLSCGFVNPHIKICLKQQIVLIMLKMKWKIRKTHIFFWCVYDLFYFFFIEFLSSFVCLMTSKLKERELERKYKEKQEEDEKSFNFRWQNDFFSCIPNHFFLRHTQRIVRHGINFRQH